MSWLDHRGRAAVIAAALAVVFLGFGLGSSGLIDPYELERAELARRVAVHALGADHLALEGDPGRIPTLGDLGSGELGLSSVALGFATFGLSEWAGRLPLALWAFGGAVALFLLLSSLARPTVAVYGVVALVTMPAYFLQARMVLGDAAAMAAFAICFSGLTLAVFDDRRRSFRAVALAAGLGGAVAGFFARGLLLGVAAPLLAVGLSWLLQRQVRRRREHPHVLGAVTLAGGLVASVLGILPFLRNGWAERAVTRPLGLRIEAAPPVEATFDLVVRELGYALFPWSAILPLALAALFLRGSRDLPPRELGLRLSVCLGAAIALFAQAFVAPYAGSIPFVGLACLAAALGIALGDLEERPWSTPAAIVVVVVLALLYRDLRDDPSRLLAGFGLPRERAAELAGPLDLRFAAVAFGLLTAGDLLEGPRRGELGRFVAARKESYRASLRTLAGLFKGNLAFAFLLLEAALLGVAATLVVGRHLGWTSVMSISLHWARIGLNAWWILPLGLAAIPLGYDGLRIGLGALFARHRLGRGAGIALGAIVAGAFLCFSTYPALAARLSPKGAFERYRDLRAPNEPLAVLGLEARGAHYHADGPVTRFASPAEAHRWLLAGDRRWLVLREDDLAALNEGHRAATGENLPILAAERPMLLASNELGSAESQNPLDPFVGGGAKDLQHPLDHRLGDALDVLGWSLLDDRGSFVEAIEAGQSYRLNVHYRVLSPMARDYQAFLHLDGEGRRHNGDHPPVGGMYPTSRWRPGDVIVDPYDLRLSTSFPPGRYRLYFGLFRGGDRMPVTAGPHQADRIVAGTITVL